MFGWFCFVLLTGWAIVLVAPIANLAKEADVAIVALGYFVLMLAIVAIPGLVFAWLWSRRDA